MVQIQQNILNYLNKHKDEQALLFTKSKVNNELETIKNCKLSTLENYKQEIVNKVSSINFDSINLEFINLIDEILISTDYERALCIINNKGLIQESGLTSEFGLKQSNYIEIALKIIRDDDILQDYIKQYINIE